MVAQNFTIIPDNSIKDKVIISRYSTTPHIAIDYGTTNFSEGISPAYFKIVNNCDTPLVIQSVSWGEPMFAPTWSKEIIYKNQSGFIRYVCPFQDRVGRYEKSSYCETNLGSIVVTFKGNILSKGVLIEKEAVIDKVIFGDTLEHTFIIKNMPRDTLEIGNSEYDTLKITGIKFDPDWVWSSVDTDSIMKIPPGSFKQFNLRCVAGSIGNFHARAIISMKNNFEIRFDMYAEVRDKTRIAPKEPKPKKSKKEE